jgi:hypothetical protein
MDHVINKTEAKNNKEAYNKILEHLKYEDEIKWIYKATEKNNKINVILQGSIGRKRKKVALTKIPSFIVKNHIKELKEKAPKAEKGELLVKWVDAEEEKGSLFFCNGEGVSQAESLMMCAYFDKDRFDLINGTLHPCLIRQLEKLGYDLSTLCFSIKKKNI